VIIVPKEASQDFENIKKKEKFDMNTLLELSEEIIEAAKNNKLDIHERFMDALIFINFGNCRRIHLIYSNEYYTSNLLEYDKEVIKKGRKKYEVIGKDFGKKVFKDGIYKWRILSSILMEIGMFEYVLKEDAGDPIDTITLAHIISKAWDARGVSLERLINQIKAEVSECSTRTITIDVGKSRQIFNRKKAVGESNFHKGKDWKKMMKIERKELKETPLEEKIDIRSSNDKIIKKYDLDYNTFIKLGRELKYKIILLMEGENWRIRSKIMWENYWNRFNVGNWIYIAPNEKAEETLLNLDLTFRILEKYGVFELYKVYPNEEQTAIKYHIERKVHEILESLEEKPKIEVNVSCKKVDKIKQFIKKRNERNRNKVEEGINKKLEKIKCKVMIELYNLHPDKEEQYIKNISTKFRELNKKLKGISINYMIGLNTLINYKTSKPREKNKANPDMTYHDIVILNEFDMEKSNKIIVLSNKRKRKKIRLTMPERYKPKFDETRKSRPLNLAFESLIENLSDEEKKLKELIRRSTIKDEGELNYESNETKKQQERIMK
jgi:hypothetical protein